jgi:hypothetical protein
LEEVLLYLSEYITKDGAVGSLKVGNMERGKAIPIHAYSAVGG